ncbi:MAG TPA: hypothetical protein PLG90_04750 [Ignavibacteria bacterium]|nr:hypothetical protein [Ignavibacteria bacterium]
MKNPNTKLKFIKLRGAGYSFSKIAKYLRVSKWTLIRWAKEHQKILSDLQKIHLESLKESIFISEKNKLELLVKDFYQLDNDANNYEKTLAEREILLRMKYSILDKINKFEKDFSLKIFDDDFNIDEHFDLKYLDVIENLEKSADLEINSNKNVSNPEISSSQSADDSENLTPEQIYYHKFKPLLPDNNLPISDEDENNKKSITYNPLLKRSNGSHNYGSIPFEDYSDTHLNFNNNEEGDEDDEEEDDDDLEYNTQNKSNEKSDFSSEPNFNHKIISNENLIY